MHLSFFYTEGLSPNLTHGIHKVVASWVFLWGTQFYTKMKSKIFIVAQALHNRQLTVRLLTANRGRQ